MDGKLVVMTLGFDTRFQMKTLARIASSMADKVIIVRPEEESDMAGRAEEELARFARDILGLEMEVVRVPVVKPEEAVARIALAIRRHAGRSIIADLSGGMRSLILETLAALLNEARGRLDIIVWLENLKSEIMLDPSLFNLPLVDEISLKILGELRSGPLTLRELKDRLGRPKSTVYVKIRRLVDQGLIRRRMVPGGTIVYEITQPGLTVYLMGLEPMRRTGGVRDGGD